MKNPSVAADLRAKAMLIERILNETYGAPFMYWSRKDPLSEPVGTLLSHRTKNAVTRSAYQNLRARFPTWEEVRTAPTEEVEKTVAAVTYPEVKAPRIQNALTLIKERRNGDLSLDFLAEMTVSEARAWPAKIPGVGAKSTAAVLNFSILHMPALVVDMHHLRVAQRTGVVPVKATLDKSAKILQEYLPADYTGQQVFDTHQGYIRHGQKVCTWSRPACNNCVIKEHCDYYAEKQTAVIS